MPLSSGGHPSGRPPAPPGRTRRCSSSSSSGPPGPRPSRGSDEVKPDARLHRDLAANVLGTPKWDGSATSWSSFVKTWDAYWALHKRIVAPEGKSLFFLQCLPSQWRDHMRAYITESGWSFDQVFAFLGEQNKLLAPPWRLLQDWRSCYPAGSTFQDFLHWWLTWTRLGQKAGIDREDDWIQQFDAALNHKGFFRTQLRQILEEELLANQRWSLSRRKTFVSNVLSVRSQTDQHIEDRSSQGLGSSRPSGGSSRTRPMNPSSGLCFFCHKPGHLASDCPAKRSQARSPGRSHKPAGSWRDRPSGPSSGHLDRGSSHRHSQRPNHRDHPRSPSGGGSGSKGNSFRSTSRGSARSHGSGSRGSSLSEGERQRRFRDGLCLLCGKGGHRAAHCPVKRSHADRRASSQHAVSSSGSEGTRVSFRSAVPSGRPTPSSRSGQRQASRSDPRPPSPAARPSGRSSRPPPGGGVSHDRMYRRPRTPVRGVEGDAVVTAGDEFSPYFDWDPDPAASRPPSSKE